jgi:drug/metabolite transporter (DMT)-like permease
VKPTRIRLLAAIAVIAAAIGWGLARVMENQYGHYLGVPWTAPITLGLLALAIVLWTRGIRARLAGKPGTKPLPSLVAARTTALAMAGSRTGAFFLGFYVGVALELLPATTQVDAARHSAYAAVASVVTGLSVIAAALWLERSCRLPDPPAEVSVDGPTHAAG